MTDEVPVVDPNAPKPATTVLTTPEPVDAPKPAVVDETPEAKVAREKIEADAKVAADQKAKDEAVPEKYEFKFQEGLEVDAPLVEKFTPLAKELKLNNAGAQKLVDFYTGVRKEFGDKMQKDWDTLTEGWAAAAKADPEMGGDKWGGSLKDAKLALEKLGTPKLLEDLETTKMGNHPEVIRLLTKVGRLLADDKLHHGGPPGGTKPNTGDLIYTHPSSQPKQ